MSSLKLICGSFKSSSRNLAKLTGNQRQCNFNVKLGNNSCRFSSSYASSLADKFYSEEQLELQKTLRKIIETDINPYISEWEEKQEWPSHSILKTLGNAGLLGINKPTEYGGLGLDYKYEAAFLEELGNINCGGVPSSITVHTDMSTPALSRFGSSELRKEFLEPAIKGDVVSCVGVSEPAAGSDVAGLKTSAVRNGDDLVINGEKVWITNGLKADWMCLCANTSEGNPHKNKSLIIVPLNSKGITRTKIKKMGLHCSDWAQVYFDNVRVPAKNIIGEPGMGFIYQMKQFQEERLAIVLSSLRAFDNLIGETIDYTRQRKAFGKSILDNQVVQFRLAELATEVEALRVLTYKAVEMNVAGEDVTLIASMVKLKGGRLARELCDSLLQYWGGMGFSLETNVSRFYRDLRSFSIAGGADEIITGIICKLLGIPGTQQPKPKK